MKRGLRFQTKLMLTFVIAISAVTLALITATETKISEAYRQQFSRDFNRLVRQLDRSHEERSHEFLDLCTRLAAHPYIVASLEGKPQPGQESAFWKTYLESLVSLDGGPAKPPGAAKRPVLPSPDLMGRSGSVGIVTLAGEITTLLPPLSAMGRDGEKRRPTNRLRQKNGGIVRAKKRIDSLLRQKKQQTLYLPFENAENVGFVQEMMSTPVVQPETGEVIGLFLRAIPAETEAQRFLERYQEEFKSDSPLVGGIFLEGELFSRTLAPAIAALIAPVLAERIPRAENSGAFIGKSALTFEATVGDTPYRFYIAPLTGDTMSDPAYQVSAFSLAALKSDLAELRLRGSGIGLAALLLGIVVAWILSRKLAIPIGELTHATREIQAGHLETRIAIRSRDEIGELAASFNEMAAGLQQRDAYRGILGKVSDETVAQAMISGDLDLELGGELKQVSVLFCDIRGFTGMTEHMPPAEVIGLLNGHMTAMTAVVRRHYGVVDKFVGDEIMAVFGALKSYGNDADHATACALEMIAERTRLNRESGLPLEIGIGVASGEAIAGCMGSIDRLNYTVVGSRVNLASRLCSEAGAMEVVIDDQTLSGLGPDRVESEVIPGLRLKGFSDTVAAYRVRECEAVAVT